MDGPADPARWVGRTVGRRYKLVRMLGEGGMGAVFEARHVASGECFAVKVIHDHLLIPGSDGPSRFRREAKAAGAIDSPHIAKVVDSGADEATGTLYLAMELFRGEDLQHLIDRTGPLPCDVALRIAAQVLLGLQKAHDAGIVHRDIKPANLFLARGDGGEVIVKLLDFGIAKVIADPYDVLKTNGFIQTDGLLGSPRYMSPEQLQSSADVDQRSDVWSLGGVLHSALTGVPPHHEVKAVGKLLLAICTTPVTPVEDIAPWIPAEVSAVVHRALAIRARERYPSAGAMFEALLPLLPGGFELTEEMLTGVPGELRRRASSAKAALEPAPTPFLEHDSSGRAREHSVSAATLLLEIPRAEITRDGIPREEIPRSAAPTVQADPAPLPRPRITGWRRPAVVVAACVAGMVVSFLITSWLRKPSSVIDAERLASFAPLPADAGPLDPVEIERANLGRALFADPRLSKNGDVSCTTCHPLGAWGADGKRVSHGSDGKETPRNTLSIYNVSGFFTLLWDGRKDNLVDQAKEVLQSPRAMATDEARLTGVLRGIPAYAGAFAEAFPEDPEPVSFDNTARALAAYESTLFTRGRWDRFLEGDTTAITDQEKAGFNRFVEVGCISCHFGPNVGATMFQKVGLVKTWPDTRDRGRYEITKRDVDMMVFRVPTLRNVDKTGPYFHDGSVGSLETAIRMMARHQIGQELGSRDVTLIASWLRCLTGEIPGDAEGATRSAAPSPR